MKQKITKLTAVLLLLVSVLTFSVPVFANEKGDTQDRGNTTDESEKTQNQGSKPKEGQAAFYLEDGTKVYFEADTSPIQRRGLTSSAAIHWDFANEYYGPIITDTNGNYYFCIEVQKNFPTGQTYQQVELTDKRYQALLAHGYPNDASGLLKKYNRSREQALLSLYIAANVISKGYTESTVRSKGDQYVNALIDLAQAEDIPNQSLTTADSLLQGHYNKTTNRLETEFISYSGTSTTFNLQGLPANTYPVDENNKKISGKIATGTKFKIVSEDLRLNSITNIKPVDHGLKKITYYQYNPPSKDLQTVIGGKQKETAVDIAPFAVKWNRALGSANIQKKSEDGVIKGLKFEIKGSDNNTKDYKKVVTTDDKGGFCVTGLVPGEYTVTEIETPNRYVTCPSQKITVVAGQTETVTFQNNIKKGKLKVFKTDMESGGKTGKPLKGVEFTIYSYNSDKKEIEKPFATLVTDENGYAVKENLPYGTYLLKETKSLSGYELLQEAIEFKVRADGEEIYYHIYNKKKETTTVKPQKSGDDSTYYSNGVQTGDDTQMVLFLVTGLLSASIGAVILKRRVRNKTR